MQKTKKIAINTFYYLVILLYFLPLIINYYFHLGLPSAFSGGFKGILLAGSIAIFVYLLSDPRDN